MMNAVDADKLTPPPFVPIPGCSGNPPSAAPPNAIRPARLALGREPCVVEASAFLVVAGRCASGVPRRRWGRRRFHATPLYENLHPPVLGRGTGRQRARLAFALPRPGHSLEYVDVSAHD